MVDDKHPGAAGSSQADHLRQRTESAARWIGTMRVFSQVLIILIALVLARLLQPEDYGLYAMVLVLVQFSFYVEGFKIEDAIVQRREANASALSSAYYFVLVASAGFTLVFLLCIPVIMWFFEEPRLLWPLMAVSTIFLMRGSAAIQRALLRRRLEIRTIALIQFGRIVPGGATGIALALLGFGMWSLVGYVLVKELAEAVALRAVVRWRATERFSWLEARQLAAFGAPASANEVVTYIQYHLPTYIIGRWLGPGTLGLFKFAFVLVAIIPAFIQHVLQQALFPALSRAQDDLALVARGYLRSLFGIMAATFLGAVLLHVFARDLILVFLGDQWAGMIPIVQVLAFLIPGMALQSLFTACFHSLGEPKRDLVLNSMLAVVLIFGFIVGAGWGIMGIVWVYVLAFPVYAGAAQHRLNNALGLSWRSVIVVTGTCLAASLAAWGMMAVVSALHPVAALPPFFRVFLLSLLACVSYAVTLWALARDETAALIRMLYHQKQTIV